MKQFHKLMRQLEVDSVAYLMPKELKEVVTRLRSRKDVLEYGLDDYYTRALLKQVPKIVHRALKIEPVFTQDPPRGPAQTYLSEATRTYLLGFFQASVALSRSALEEGLRDSLHAHLSNAFQTDELSEMIRLAGFTVLRNPDLLQFAHDIRKKGNEVLHGSPCGEQEAFDLLIKSRSVLDALYGGRE
jgi:hypothetical protein